MANRGVLSGVSQIGYEDYDPELKAFVPAGVSLPTDPVLGNGTAYARFNLQPNGRVHYYGALTFGSTSTYGSGDYTWGISLPVPANRSSGGADIPIGDAYIRKALTDDPCSLVNLVPTLMDPLEPGARQSNEDRWMQFFSPYLLAYGTGTITATTGNLITHNLGNAATGFTPSAYDVHIVCTETPSTAPGLTYVVSTSSTQVDIGVRTDPGASDLDFAWKIKAEPNASTYLTLLVSYGVPWRQASGHVIGWDVEYEARR